MDKPTRKKTQARKKVTMQVMKKVIPKKAGYLIRDFDSDDLGYKFVKIKYVRRGMVGKILKKYVRKITVPKGMRVIKMENNKPSVGQLTITFKKR